VAAEIGAGFHLIGAPMLKQPGALLELLLSLEEREVLFIDEIHRLPVPVAESLYQAMEDGRLSFIVGCGSLKRTLHLRLNPFTLIGATTDIDRVPPALRGRFGICQSLEHYRVEHLVELLRRCAARAGLAIDEDAAALLAEVSRGTPREAIRLFDAAADLAARGEKARLELGTARLALQQLGIDAEGLRPLEREYLAILQNARDPLGRRTIAGRLGVSVRALVNDIEPPLLRCGFVHVTRWGRVCETRGRRAAGSPGTPGSPTWG
jgi:Holliday junction DNA helicase RuvB